MGVSEQLMGGGKWEYFWKFVEMDGNFERNEFFSIERSYSKV
jgi:hypothetical protein